MRSTGAVQEVINPFPVGGHLLAIKLRDQRPYAAQRRSQERLLRDLVLRAARSVPHYQTSYAGIDLGSIRKAEDLAVLPTLDRDVVRASAADGSLLADGFRDTARPGARTLRSRTHSTSGSSGIPVIMHNSERDLGYLRATYVEDMLYAGLRPLDRIAYFRPASFLQHPLARFGILRMFHIDTRGDIGRQADEFLAVRPTFLTGFPHTIASIVDELQRRGIRYRGVRRIVFGGERLTPTLRAHILDYFDAAGLEIYSAVETFTIARSCSEGALHIRPSDVVVEIEHDDGSVSVADGVGEILVTRLRSEAMPLIRYRLGDRVRMTPSACPCGRDTPIVAEVIGRKQDLIYDRLGRGASVDSLNMPLLGFREIARLQVVQEVAGVLVVRVVLEPGTPDGVVAAMTDRVRAALPEFDDVRVVAVPRIEAGPNGKIRVVRSALAPGDTHPPTPLPLLSESGKS